MAIARGRCAAELRAFGLFGGTVELNARWTL